LPAEVNPAVTRFWLYNFRLRALLLKPGIVCVVRCNTAGSIIRSCVVVIILIVYVSHFGQVAPHSVNIAIAYLTHFATLLLADV